jgi:uncharacterized protein
LLQPRYIAIIATMPLQLTLIEARVLGSLIEKAHTTPDQYPLSLNALVNACNQKSSRDPVMSLDETTVVRAIATLKEKNLVGQKSESGNRVPKFFHRVENLLNGGTSKEIGAICVLLLRGPQTPGEIKTRTDRLCEFESTAEVEVVLNELASRTDGPLVARLPRQSGQKETRFVELFSGKTPHPNPLPGERVPAGQVRGASVSAQSTAPPSVDRLARLEQRVDALEAQLKALQPKN